MVKGEVHGVARYFYQNFAHRPTPDLDLDLDRLSVPGLDNLYLVGAFMHPGGDVSGAGRGTNRRPSRGALTTRGAASETTPMSRPLTGHAGGRR